MREQAALLEARVPSATSRRSDTPTRRVLPPRRIYQAIADALAQRINAEEWPDGFALPSERDLCRQFSASRTAVREALAALQASGLIAIRQRSRARVTLLRN